MHRDRLKRHGRIRLLLQLAAAALLNGYAAGFAKGSIFTGKSKAICVPVLNCYSCPAALGACPIGAMQNIAAGRTRQISFYVLGTLMLFGTLLGRLFCGFCCPFGLIQDLLYKIPLKKRTVPPKADLALRYVKYGILAGLVLLLPALVTDDYGTGLPRVCKYLCPAGTLEAGIPLLLRSPALRRTAGLLFLWKAAVLLLILLSAVRVSRCFCRYLCPLGAFYALFNRFCFVQMSVDRGKCTGCGSCSKVCPMAIEPPKAICSGECIRCGRCKAVCPAQAIAHGTDRHT